MLSVARTDEVIAHRENTQQSNELIAVEHIQRNFDFHAYHTIFSSNCTQRINQILPKTKFQRKVFIISANFDMVFMVLIQVEK